MSLPIQTAVEIDGVNPTIQASELSSPWPWVPVLLATGRSPSRLRREYSATPSMEKVVSLATSAGMACVPVSTTASGDTMTPPDASVTCDTMCVACRTPPLAMVANPAAWSIGRISYSPMPMADPVKPSALASVRPPSRAPPDHVSGMPVAASAVVRTFSAPTS